MKTILITGASHGIGKAIAEKLAACSMRLFLNCRSSKETLYEYAVKLSETYHVPRFFMMSQIINRYMPCLKKSVLWVKASIF